MEVVIPVKAMEFDFNSTRSSPHTNAPSTPRRIGGGDYYFSAPSSPTRVVNFYREFDEFLIANSSRESCAAVPFAWEERPGKPKSPKRHTSSVFEDDFAFDVSGEFDRNSLSAEELFDGGVIKPLKPPPRLQLPTGENEYLLPKSPARSSLSQGKKMIRRSFSPKEEERERGRERISTISSSPSRRTRSLSPLRNPGYPWREEERTTKRSTATSTSTKPPSASPTTSALSTISSKGSRKWSLKDFFLFRSASDGRAMDRDPLKKYSPFYRRQDDIRNSSLRAIENPGSGSSSKRRGRASAHELHYTMNRAVSNDMKKKTFLPYKQGILGRLAFNPTVHALANGFGFSHK